MGLSLTTFFGCVTLKCLAVQQLGMSRLSAQMERLLELLDDEQPHAMKELVTTLYPHAKYSTSSSKYASVSRSLKALEERGLVEKKPFMWVKKKNASHER